LAANRLNTGMAAKISPFHPAIHSPEKPHGPGVARALFLGSEFGALHEQALREAREREYRRQLEESQKAR